MKLPKFSPKLNKDNLSWPLFVRVISGHSMVPVLPPGTYVWATPWFSQLKAGDVVVFFHNGKEKIKRISDLRDNEMYVLGDHTESSTDSRHFGWIPKDSVRGKVIWPNAKKVQAESLKNGQ